jgi:hypothetical protein
MYRVIQWATGYIGNLALKAIIEDPELELVGVFVYSSEKEGRDAGDLVGLAPTGVIATTNRELILGLDADVVIHCPSGVGPMKEHDDDVIALLNSGKNVISTLAYASPLAHGAEYAETLETACRMGAASLMGGGINPDFAGSWLPAALTRMCTDVKHVRVSEVDDMSLDPHVPLLVDLVGIGKRPEEITSNGTLQQYIVWAASEIPDLLARNLGAALEKCDLEFEIHTATRDFSIPGTDIPKDSVCGGRVAFHGYSNGSPFVDIELIWSVQPDHPKFPSIPSDTRFVIEIEGSPSSRTVIDLSPSLNSDAVRSSTDLQAVMHATAACATNAIPQVCAAPPGLFTQPVPGAWRSRRSGRLIGGPTE